MSTATRKSVASAKELAQAVEDMDELEQEVDELDGIEDEQAPWDPPREYVEAPDGDIGAWMDFVFESPDGKYMGLVNINMKSQGPVTAPQLFEMVRTFQEGIGLMVAAGLGRPAAPSWHRQKRIDEGVAPVGGAQGNSASAPDYSSMTPQQVIDSSGPSVWDARFFFQEKNEEGKHAFLIDQAGNKNPGLQWSKVTSVSFEQKFNPKLNKQVSYATVKTIRTPEHGVKAFQNDKGYSPCDELVKILQAAGHSIQWNGPPIDTSDGGVYVQISYKMRQEAEARMKADGAKFAFSDNPDDYTPGKVVFVTDTSPVGDVEEVAGF